LLYLLLIFVLLILLPLLSPLFPYTTLFRSHGTVRQGRAGRAEHGFPPRTVPEVHARHTGHQRLGRGPHRLRRHLRRGGVPGPAGAGGTRLHRRRLPPDEGDEPAPEDARGSVAREPAREDRPWSEAHHHGRSAPPRPRGPLLRRRADPRIGAGAGRLGAQ